MRRLILMWALNALRRGITPDIEERTILYLNQHIDLPALDEKQEKILFEKLFDALKIYLL